MWSERVSLTVSMKCVWFCLICLSFSGARAKAQVPHYFFNGDVADADQVNENFDSLTSTLEELRSEVEQLRMRVSDLEKIPHGGVLVEIGSTIVPSGGSSSVSARLLTNRQVASLEFELAFPLNVQLSGCEVNPTIDKNATAFGYRPDGCLPGSSCSSVRAIVFSFSNLDPIPSGSTLITCQVDVGLSSGDFPLQCSAAGASDPAGGGIETQCTDGRVDVFGFPLQRD